MDTSAPPTLLFWLVIGLSTAFILAARTALRRSVTSTDWKLSSALSEEAERDDRGNPLLDRNGRSVLIPSSNRLIAFIGMVMTSIYLGVGYYTLWALFFGGDLATVKETGIVFVTGAAFFAPYAVNKLSEIFKR
jgi:hypothetical protein